ncbi:hypothetical protein [Pseudomonas sp. Bc-h]|uniref:hypothetical protein n=1 Tax=Pseudomonas sp. Bc-h TaxID=1943632 RepID=UPI00117B5A79|nr:hypothetical protein [Pseudomonas sp. Bc-h]
MMRKVPIDEEGCINNPFASSVPEFSRKTLWGGIAYRRGKKIKMGSFLPGEDGGKRINVSGVVKGLYLAFGLAGCTERLIYLVDNVTEDDVVLQSVEASAVPSIYDISLAMPLKIYLLEARQAMLVDQMSSLNKDIAVFKKSFAASTV